MQKSRARRLQQRARRRCTPDLRDHSPARSGMIALRIYLLYASLTFLSCIVISIASSEHPLWRGPRKEAKRGPPCGPRVTRASWAMMVLLHTCATPCWSLMAGRCSSGETPGGQQGTPALTRPHRRDGCACCWWRCGVPAVGPLWVAKCPTHSCATRCSIW